MALAVAPLRGCAYGLAALYLFFGAGMAPGGADRPGEPLPAWRAYGVASGLLAVLVPVAALAPSTKPLVIVPLACAAFGFVVHVRAKVHLGVCRIGVLSALGRREHDARVGRALEAMLLAMGLGALGHGPASAGLFAVAGWLLTVAAVAERRDPATSAREDQPPASGPAPVA